MSYAGTEMHSTRRASFALFLPMANWRCRRCSTTRKCEIFRWGRGAHAGLGRVRATMGVLATKDEAMMNTTKQPLPSAASCKVGVVPSTESRRGRTVFCKSSPCRRSRTTLCRVAASYTCPQDCRYVVQLHSALQWDSSIIPFICSAQAQVMHAGFCTVTHQDVTNSGFGVLAWLRQVKLLQSPPLCAPVPDCFPPASSSHDHRWPACRYSSCGLTPTVNGKV